ncbi:MAG: cytochrome c [Chloroflexia bacterium]
MDTIGRQVTAFVTMFMAAGLIILMYMIFEPQRQAAASNEQVHTAVERGRELFAENCIVCHGTNGQGIQGAGFALHTDGNKAPDDDRRAFLFNTISRGRQNSNGWDPNMPAFGNSEGGAFNEQQINDVITFIGCATDDEWKEVADIVSVKLGTPVAAILTPPNLGTPNVTFLPGVKAAGPTAAAGAAAADPGAAVFQTNCINCHRITPEFANGQQVGPNLTGVGARLRSPAARQASRIKSTCLRKVPPESRRGFAIPSAIRPGSGMPAFGPDKISDSDMKALTDWLATHTEEAAPEAAKSCFKTTAR